MKTVFHLVLAILIISCTKDEGPFIFHIGEEFALEEGYSATMIIPSDNWSNKSELDVQVMEINDSRCPTGAVCIWAGLVQVNFLIEGNDITLCLGCPSGQGNPIGIIQASGRAYKIELLDVRPYPMISKPDPFKEAYFIVTRL